MSRSKIFAVVREVIGRSFVPGPEIDMGDQWMDLLGIPRDDEGLKTSEKGLALIKEFESCKLSAYQDGGGVWTIGWGHTAGVKPEQRISQLEADEMLRMDIEDREIELNEVLAGVPTKQCEFDALMSFVYNVGFGRVATAERKAIPGLKTSTLLKRHKLGNRLGAANAFLMWKYDNGKVVRGLLRRREAERKLYLGEA